MKLYLSSYRLPTPDDLFELVGKKPAAIKLAFIPNAGDYYAERARSVKIQASISSFTSAGITQVEVVDLRMYRDAQKLKQTLSKYDLVWCSGGNTFCLREEIKKSGFENIIKDLLVNGLVYGGESAGSIVAGPTLKGVEGADNPGFAESTIFEGLNLTDKIIIPHADNLSMKEELTPMFELYKDNPNTVVLNDNQAFIIDGTLSRLVTGPKI